MIVGRKISRFCDDFRLTRPALIRYTSSLRARRARKEIFEILFKSLHDTFCCSSVASVAAYARIALRAVDSDAEM